MSFLAVLLVAALIFIAFVAIRAVVMNAQVNVSGYATAFSTASATDAEGVTSAPLSIPAAQPATLTVRSGNTTGTLTMTNSSHGIITGQRLDLYWAGGQCFGAVAGTVAGTSVPIASVAGGSNLPAASTAITVGIPVQTSFPVTGNNVQGLVCSAPNGPAYFCFYTGSDVAQILVTPPAASVYIAGSLGSNPLAGVSPTSVWMSHNYTVAAVTTQFVSVVTH